MKSSSSTDRWEISDGAINTRKNTQTIIFEVDWRTLQCQIAYSVRFRRRWRFVLWNSGLEHDTVQSGVRVPTILKKVLTPKWTNVLTIGVVFPAETHYRPRHMLHKQNVILCAHSDCNLTHLINLPKGFLNTSVIYSSNIHFRRLYACHLQCIWVMFEDF